MAVAANQRKVFWLIAAVTIVCFLLTAETTEDVEQKDYFLRCLRFEDLFLYPPKPSKPDPVKIDPNDCFQILRMIRAYGIEFGSISESYLDAMLEFHDFNKTAAEEEICGFRFSIGCPPHLKDYIWNGIPLPIKQPRLRFHAGLRSWIPVWGTGYFDAVLEYHKLNKTSAMWEICGPYCAQEVKDYIWKGVPYPGKVV